MKPISRPTAGIANWPARSASDAHQAPANGSEATQVGEGVQRRQPHHRQHAHVGPGHRAAGAPPPEDGDAGLRDHDERDERAHRGGEPVVRREVAERGGGDGGPGEEEGTQAAEDEQGAELRLQRRRARCRPRRRARGARSGSARRRRRRSARPVRRLGTGSGARTGWCTRPISASVVPTDSQASRGSSVALPDANSRWLTSAAQVMPSASARGDGGTRAAVAAARGTDAAAASAITRHAPSRRR